MKTKAELPACSVATAVALIGGKAPLRFCVIRPFAFRAVRRLSHCAIRLLALLRTKAFKKDFVRLTCPKAEH